MEQLSFIDMLKTTTAKTLFKYEDEFFEDCNNFLKNMKAEKFII